MESRQWEWQRHTDIDSAVKFLFLASCWLKCCKLHENWHLFNQSLILCCDTKNNWEWQTWNCKVCKAEVGNASAIASRTVVELNCFICVIFFALFHLPKKWNSPPNSAFPTFCFSSKPQWLFSHLFLLPFSHKLSFPWMVSYPCQKLLLLTHW